MAATNKKALQLPTKPISMLVYGTESSGKSWLIQSLDNLLAKLNGRGASIIYDFEDGYGALDIKGRLVPDWSDAAQAKAAEDTPKMFAHIIRTCKNEVGADPSEKAGLVAVDGLSEQEIELLHHLTTVEDKTAPDNDLKPNWDAWGDNLALFSASMQALKPRRIGAYIIATARMTPTSDPTDPENDKKFIYGPAVRGKFGMHVSHYFDIVAYMAKLTQGGTTRRRMYFRASGASKFRTKCRWEHVLDSKGGPLFPEYLEWDTERGHHIDVQDILKLVATAQATSGGESTPNK